MTAIYKCRLCGEKFKDCETGHDIAFILAVGITSSEYYTIKGQPTFHRTMVHNCEDGSIGFADFQGFKREDDK